MVHLDITDILNEVNYMLEIAVCDDNELALITVVNMVRELCEEALLEINITSFLSGGELIEAYNEVFYDIIFLDIFMPKIDGFEVAHYIRTKKKKTFLIFITSQEELVYQSFEYEPYSFIRKRTDELIRKDIADVIKRLFKHFRQEQILSLETAYHLQERVRIKEIIYVYSEKNYLQYILIGNRSIKVRQTMSECETALREYGFLRIHRSLLVNMQHITNINYKENGVYISNGEILEIGKTYKAQIGERYFDYSK